MPPVAARPLLIAAVITVFVLVVYAGLLPLPDVPGQPWALLPLPTIPGSVLHAAGALAVFALLLRLSDQPSAMAATLTFALLPMLVDTSALMPSEVASAVFSVIAVLLHTRHHPSARIAGLVCLAVAVAWHESAVVVPLFLLSHDLLFGRLSIRGAAVWHAGSLVIIASHLAVRALVMGTPRVGGDVARLYALQITGWLPLHAPAPSTIVLAATAAACLGASVAAWRRPSRGVRLTAWGTLWFALSLAPASVLGAPRHTSYLPSVGLALVIAAATRACIERARRYLRPHTVAAVAGLPVGSLWTVLALTSAHRAHDWRADRTRHALLCEAESRSALWASAESACREALRFDPNLVDARYSLAVSLESRGRTVEAAEEARRVLDRHPDHPGARSILSRCESR
jgi:hypothetical protein